MVMMRRMMPLFVMQPDVRWDHPLTRIMTMIRYALGQARFFRRFELMHGLAHVLIFWGFLALGINTMRCDQLLNTGARTFATACPYCLIMLDDAVKEKNLEDEITVLDLAEMLDRATP